ncbi:MAG TPA: S8 family serine peptidase [Bryobacteraceae bacterium]|nr:S8 family serine peptidase [Bryobacteraceae bacterium]
MKLRSLLLITILLMSAGRALRGDTEINNGHTVAAHQVIFKLGPPPAGTSTATVIQQLQQLGGADNLRLLSASLNIYVMHSAGNNVATLLNIVRLHPSVVYVEPDYVHQASAIPNDTYFSSQWALLNTTTPGADIGATLAWDVSTGSTANVVASTDTGIDYTHPDLAANVWSAPSQFQVTLSWGQLTCPQGSHGYNTITRSCTPLDDNGHGTHTAGTIGAVGNNATGVAGVNWTTSIMALKFLDSSGSGSTSDAIDAIEFGLQAKTIFGSGANLRVLSASWGSTGFSQSLLDEINKANTADVLFVAAAGNNSASNDTTPFYPASFNAPNVIAVAATTNTDSLASFSNYGKNSVHLGAPGVNIISTLPNVSYGYLSGTSMATPHVSGAAMLVLSKCALNTAALKSTLLANVDPVASLSGITITGGRLDVNKALRSCAGAPPPTGAASYVKTDTTTAGNWKGAYGADGYNVINDTVNYPSYVTVTPAGNAPYTWASSTSAPQALQKASSTTDRIAACWFSGSFFTIDLSFNDANTHQLALYLMDWDGGRSERVDILNAAGGVLDTRTVSSFTAGEYLVWNVSGHVIVRITNTGSNAVMSGIFFGTGGTGTSPPPSGAATYVKADTTTAGTWKGVYGADGANVINDTANYPSYVAVTPAGNTPYTWVSSTTNTRALQKISSTTDRIAACWYTGGSFTIDLNFSDTNTHQLALYFLDWDGGRSERVDILDTNNDVLDTRTVTAFTAGEYLVWNVSGHVVARITNTGSNAVVSGIFFSPGTSANNPVPAITLLAPTSATVGGTAFTLTVNGTGFVSGSSVVNWNGSARATTYLSATQLQAAITAADIGNAGTAQVTVFNPTPGGGTSGSLPFSINAAPAITSLAPTSATAGGAAFTLTVNGTGFVSGSSVVNWNGSARATTYLSATQLQAAITAADIGTAGTAQVTVFNSPGGGTSGSFAFPINPALAITSLAPTSATAGGAAFTLTVNGTGFVSGSSVVNWNGSGRTTTYLSATQLQAAITAADIGTAGIAQVTVFNSPGGGTSGSFAFPINPANNPGTSVTYVKTDTTTAGTWKGVYGTDGFNVINDTVSYPSYVTVTPSGNASYTWVSSTSDTRALQKASSTTDRIAACWYTGGYFTIDLKFNDANTHSLALYLLDWDGGRNERVDILDTNNNVLDTRTVTAFIAGEYLVWNVSGHVVARITNTGSNAVVSGIFFGSAGAPPPPPSGGTASYVKTDTTTAGTWKGAYGADGFNVINDTVNYPSYVTVTPSGNSAYTWVASTSAPQALQKASSTTDRIAACWYTGGVISIDLNFNDTNTHQMALYLLDWDGGRSERVDILDASNNVLDTRTVTAFTAGEYLVWNVSGHVVARITNTGSNAVVSGIFFR